MNGVPCGLGGESRVMGTRLVEFDSRHDGSAVICGTLSHVVVSSARTLYEICPVCHES